MKLPLISSLRFIFYFKPHLIIPLGDSETAHIVVGGRVYVGGWEAAEDLSLLQEAGISHVVNCTTDLQCPHTQTLRSDLTEFFNNNILTIYYNY